MKIVLATHHYPPTYQAGVELLTERLARWLTTRGHTVDVVCIEDIDHTDSLAVDSSMQDGVLVHRIRAKLTGNALPLGVRHRDEALACWFEEYLRRTRPDVLHSQSSYLLSASLIDVAHDLGVPTVATLHDYWYFCPKFTLLRSDGRRCSGLVEAAECARCIASDQRSYRVLNGARQKLDSWPWIAGRTENWFTKPQFIESMADRQTHLHSVLTKVDQIVTIAPLTRQLLLSLGVPASRVKFLRQGLQDVPASAKDRELQEGKLRIGYLGQLAPHKGVHLLIEAFQKLVPGASSPELHIYGDASRSPKYSSKLQALARSARDVYFRGVYRHDEVWSVLRDIDVVVVPSVWFEISPLVILEAFAAGIPVIASDLPNMNYQVRHEVDGLLFRPDDADHLREALQRLIDDGSLLSQLRAGIPPVHGLEQDPDQEIEDIYREVLAKREVAAAAG